jgi:hypothetical protein
VAESLRRRMEMPRELGRQSRASVLRGDGELGRLLVVALVEGEAGVAQVEVVVQHRAEALKAVPGVGHRHPLG